MSIFASKQVPFLDNVPANLWFEFWKASEGYASHTFD